MTIPPFNRTPIPGRGNSDDEPSEPKGVPAKFNLPNTTRQRNKNPQQQQPQPHSKPQPQPHPKPQPQPQLNQQKKPVSKQQVKQDALFAMEAEHFQSIEDNKDSKDDDQKHQQHKQEKNLKNDLQENPQATFDQPKVFLGQSVYGQVANVQKVDLSKVTEIIQKMVNQMLVGGIGQTQIASVELKTSEVPPMFAGSTITLTTGVEGMVIKFENFKTPQDEAAAIRIIENNPQAMQQLIQNLNSKNVTVSQIQVGEQQVAISRTEPSPINLIPPASAETSQEQWKERQDQQGGGQEQRQQDKEPEDESKR